MNNAQRYAMRMKALQDGMDFAGDALRDHQAAGTVPVTGGFLGSGSRQASVAELKLAQAKGVAEWLLKDIDWDEEPADEPRLSVTLSSVKMPPELKDLLMGKEGGDPDVDAGRFQDPEQKFGKQECSCPNGHDRLPEGSYAKGCTVHDPELNGANEYCEHSEDPCECVNTEGYDEGYEDDEEEENEWEYNIRITDSELGDLCDILQNYTAETDGNIDDLFGEDTHTVRMVGRHIQLVAGFAERAERIEENES